MSENYIFGKRKEYPVRAMLVTRHGFSKPIDLEPATQGGLRPVIRISVFESLKNVMTPITSEDIPPSTACIRQVEFTLERYRISVQKNGKEHIVATYREAQ